MLRLLLLEALSEKSNVCENVMVADVGENEKGLPRYGFKMVEYGRQNCTGMRRMA